MCIDPSWNCRVEDIFNWTQTVFLITCSILSQSEATYWFASVRLWSNFTWYFTYDNGNLDWCKGRSHFFYLLCGYGREKTYHIPLLIICSWTDTCMTWLVVIHTICLSLILYGLWTEFTIMYRSSPDPEFKAVVECFW